MAFLKSNKLFTGRDLIAHAVAVDEFQGFKYIKSHQVDKTKDIESNFKLMLGLLHDPKSSKITVEQKHFGKADEIIEYFEGLIFKAMQRDLTDFEKKITALIKAEDISLNGKDDRLPIVGSLPGVFRNNIKHDDWSERERSLRDVSDYEGTLKKRGNFEGEIVMSRYMNRSNSMLVAVLTPNQNIVKFFYDLYRQDTDRDTFKVGINLKFSAFVKSHEVSDYSKCKETFCNRVTISKEDK
jgi:hypothetical protein|tara:strand:- start:27249 stop:27968 length:720 start_codon:yes stop_codon:yes gene_type:complete